MITSFKSFASPKYLSTTYPVAIDGSHLSHTFYNLAIKYAPIIWVIIYTGYIDTINISTNSTFYDGFNPHKSRINSTFSTISEALPRMTVPISWSSIDTEYLHYDHQKKGQQGCGVQPRLDTWVSSGGWRPRLREII